jgi:hypothetical protein
LVVVSEVEGEGEGEGEREGELRGKLKVVVVVERMEEMAKAGIDKVWLAAGAVGTWVPSGGGCRVEWSGFGHAWVDVWMCGCVDAWMCAWVWMRRRDARRWGGRQGSLRGNDIR